jgi:hypothetical protein
MNKNLENIIKNSGILRDRYTECIKKSPKDFATAEKFFIERLLNEIDIYLQKLADNDEPINFNKDIKGHLYAVFNICSYKDWPEFKEYLKFIDLPGYLDEGLINKFIFKSLVNYGFPRDNIFDCCDNCRFRYKLMDFENNSGNLGIGEKYEDYE